MSVVAALLTTLLPSFAGWHMVRGPFSARFGVGGGLALAAMLLGGSAGGFLGSIWLGAIGGLLAAWLCFRRHPVVVDGPENWWLVLLPLSIGAVLLAVSVFRPLPGWDAVSIWSTHARALAVEGTHLHPMRMAATAAHPDYPPIVPVWQALAWQVHVDPDVVWPTQWQAAWLWTVGATGVLSLLGRWGPLSATLGLTLMTSPGLLGHAMSGYADITLLFFLMLGAILALDGTSRAAALILAAAALTKNEGLVFVGAILIGLFAARDSRAMSLRVSLVTVAAVAPWQLFLRYHNLTNDVVAGARLDVATVWQRLPQVADGLLRTLVSWRFAVVVLISTALIGLWRCRIEPFVAFLVALGGVVVVYALTPHDVAWHLSRSANRVLLSPVALLVVAAASHRSSSRVPFGLRSVPTDTGTERCGRPA
jgi:uncharacterized membrane protein YeaQ/YmgE (transglycosylase-associated protein family)